MQTCLMMLWSKHFDHNCYQIARYIPLFLYSILNSPYIQHTYIVCLTPITPMHIRHTPLYRLPPTAASYFALACSMDIYALRSAYSATLALFFMPSYSILLMTPRLS